MCLKVVVRCFWPWFVVLCRCSMLLVVICCFLSSFVVVGSFSPAHSWPSDYPQGFIGDAMRRDTDAPAVLGLGVFVTRFGKWRLKVYAWCSFGWSSLILFELGRCRALFASCKFQKKHLQVSQCSVQSSKVGAISMGKHRTLYQTWSQTGPIGTQWVPKVNQRATKMHQQINAFSGTCFGSYGLQYIDRHWRHLVDVGFHAGAHWILKGLSALCFSTFSTQSQKL